MQLNKVERPHLQIVFGSNGKGPGKKAKYGSGIYTSVIKKNEEIIQPKATLTKPTQSTMCAQSPTGDFLSCDPHKFPSSNLAQFSPRKAQG